MVSLNAADNIAETSGSSVFIAERDVDLAAFKMAKYETTWELWSEVAVWAASHGYTFAGLDAYQGHEAASASGTGTGTSGANWSEAQRKSRPVTNVTWQEAVVWCNAYSEMSGKQPVYYTDSGKGTVLKNWADTTDVTVTPDWTKNGYRLPTEAEWEYAARGGAQSDGTPWTYTYAGGNTVGNVAWYRENSYNLGESNRDYGAHPVGTKAANSKGLNDMSGNVWEWCWDWYADIAATTPAAGPASASGWGRVVRGGGWPGYADDAPVDNRACNEPAVRDDDHGFRVVCKP